MSGVPHRCLRVHKEVSTELRRWLIKVKIKFYTNIIIYFLDLELVFRIHKIMRRCNHVFYLPDRFHRETL